MKEIQISKFKATCLAVMEEVRRTGEPVRVTRRGDAIVEISPACPRPHGAGLLGAWRGRGAIHADLTVPAFDESDFESLQDVKHT